MKKILTMLTSFLLCVTMLTLLPAQVVASAAENEKKYVSEVKVGMGVTSEEAAKELLAEGFTILTDDKGGYADLNKDAGSKSILKAGPNQKIVYMGYKTTGNAGQAITDLAVMNMNGGYSYQNYEDMINKHMDTRIKPFVDRFVATLQEYRENLKKPQNSANYKRANYYKTLLNKMTDDDTGSKPLGDLLVNKTKYEMGDDAYNKLSDAEKKNHCDILTLLLQGNGQAVMLMETELTKASDPGSNTWVDRFVTLTPESLTERFREENPNLTPSELNAEMDKLYNDDAKRILEKWSAFNEVLEGYDDAVEKMDEIADQDVKEPTKLSDNASDQQVVDAVNEATDTQETTVEGSLATEDVIVKEYLESIKYGDGTLLEFFERPQSDFSGEENIRELYPIVESLTGGQIAGLDFLSIKDMILMAVTNEKGYQSVDIDKLEPASIYQDVNREIYQKGNVALTSDALREKAGQQDASPSFHLSPLGIVFWVCTGATAIAAASSAIAMSDRFKPQILKNFEKWQTELHKWNTKTMGQKWAGGRFKYDATNQLVDTRVQKPLSKAHLEIIRKNPKKLHEATAKFASRSAICRRLAIGFTVATAVLAAISIYTTIAEMMEYYKVDFVPIPKYIVDEVDITVVVRPDGTVVTDPNEKEKEGNEKVFSKNETAYYKVVTCNRTDGTGTDVEKKNHEILQDRSDLNGDVGKQWLALYSVKNVNRNPILADSFKVVTGKGDLPEGYAIGIHRFGEKAAFNLTSENYCYNDSPKGTYVYFKVSDDNVGKLTAAGTLFSENAGLIYTLLGILVGSALTMIVINAVNVKKKKQKKGAAE